MKKYIFGLVATVMLFGGFILSQDYNARAQMCPSRSMNVATVKPEGVAESICGSGLYKCGRGKVWTCCSASDKCCAYIGTDDQTWYTCRPQDKACP